MVEGAAYDSALWGVRMGVGSGVRNPAPDAWRALECPTVASHESFSVAEIKGCLLGVGSAQCPGGDHPGCPGGFFREEKEWASSSHSTNRGGASGLGKGSYWAEGRPRQRPRAQGTEGVPLHHLGE